LKDSVTFHDKKNNILFFEYKNGYRLFCAKSLTLFEVNSSNYDEAEILFSHFSNNWNLSIQNKSKSFDTIFLTIFFSSDCNLNCQYCYIHGAYSKPNKIVKTTTNNFLLKNEIKKIIGFNPKIVEINFFGGEPLLHKDSIFEIIEYTKKESLNNNVKSIVNITTNGTYLTPGLLNEFKKLNVNILLSLDSPPKNHNQFRALNNRKYYFEKILKNIQGFENYISTVTTITHKTPSFQNALKILIELGFKEVGFNIVYTRDASLCITKEDVERFSNELYKHNNWFIKNADKIFNIKRIKNQITNRKIKSSPCSSGINSYAITPNGEKYFCHSCVGNPEYELTNQINNIDDIRQTQITNKANLKNCYKCWAFHLCGGECWLIQKEYSQRIRNIRCAFIKEIIKIALFCKYN